MREILRKVIRRLAGISATRKTTSLTLGKSVIIHPNLEINAGHVSIGDYSYTGPGRISGLPEVRISIGKFTSIAAGVQIIGALHRSHIATYSFSRLLPIQERNRFEHGISRGDITIGSDVWIGTNVIILSGVTIGDGSIIGAGAVVTKEIPPYAVAVGVPAEVKKYRFSKEEIKLLLKMRWWDWDFKKIKLNMPKFSDESMSVVEFVRQTTDGEKS